ncbi:nucleotide exchange factor GrpE [Paenibacillus medicaginis]|uniref:Nucleotide exchange factor GrpE n=1 Tax=Paenibacillus medicaginis TaxID=1470560 RepID=A0ABV5BYX4_9BACL
MWSWRKNKEPSPEVETLRNLVETLQSQYEAGNQETLEQTSKLARLQYKNAQEMQARLERIEERLTAEKTSRQQAELMERNLQEIAGQLIGWLDDMDAIRSRLQGAGDEGWQRLLGQWSAQLLQSLAIAGILEQQVLGTTFNPELSESIGTWPHPDRPAGTSGSERTPQVRVPYEVVEVVQRGFVTAHGKLLRKSKVITLEADHNHG